MSHNNYAPILKLVPARKQLFAKKKKTLKVQVCSTAWLYLTVFYATLMSLRLFVCCAYLLTHLQHCCFLTK